jgi:hypothetical protein
VYISEFWCGVAVTLIVGFVGLIVYAVADNRKNKRKGKK